MTELSARRASNRPNRAAMCNRSRGHGATAGMAAAVAPPSAAALPAVTLPDLPRGTRVLVFPEGLAHMCLDAEGAVFAADNVAHAAGAPETFLANLHGGMCMVESDAGVLKCLPRQRVVQQPYREVRARFVLDAVTGDFNHRASLEATLSEAFAQLAGELRLQEPRDFSVDVQTAMPSALSEDGGDGSILAGFCAPGAFGGDGGDSDSDGTPNDGCGAGRRVLCDVHVRLYQLDAALHTRLLGRMVQLMGVRKAAGAEDNTWAEPVPEARQQRRFARHVEAVAMDNLILENELAGNKSIHVQLRCAVVSSCRLHRSEDLDALHAADTAALEAEARYGTAAKGVGAGDYTDEHLDDGSVDDHDIAGNGIDDGSGDNAYGHTAHLHPDGRCLPGQLGGGSGIDDHGGDADARAADRPREHGGREVAGSGTEADRSSPSPSPASVVSVHSPSQPQQQHHHRQQQQQQQQQHAGDEHHKKGQRQPLGRRLPPVRAAARLPQKRMVANLGSALLSELGAHNCSGSNNGNTRGGTGAVTLRPPTLATAASAATAVTVDPRRRQRVGAGAVLPQLKSLASVRRRPADVHHHCHRHRHGPHTLLAHRSAPNHGSAAGALGLSTSRPMTQHRRVRSFDVAAECATRPTDEVLPGSERHAADGAAAAAGRRHCKSWSWSFAAGGTADTHA